MFNVKRTIAALSVVSASTTAALVGACSDEDDNVVVPPPPGPAVVCSASFLNLTQSVVDAQGNAVANDTFATSDAVFLAVAPTDPSKGVMAQDFAFQVTDSRGNTVSSDDPVCRTFHIDQAGNVGAAAGAVCGHVFATVTDASGVQRTVIQLAPFVTTGDVTFVVQTLPDCAGSAFPSANVLQTTFTVPQGGGSGSGSGSGSCGSGSGSH